MKEFEQTLAWLKEKGIGKVDTGIVLGTGLDEILRHIDEIQSIPYSEIPHFPVPTVEFHKGQLIYARLGGACLLIMHGRLHYYEGYSMQQIAFPVRIMKLLGVKRLFLSNAAGAVNLRFKKGDLVLLDDHINLQGSNPLIGANLPQFGPRFPDMSRPYNRELNSLLTEGAQKLAIPIQQGVYAAVNGPNLETRAEYRMLKLLGADIVGMSTVPEVITANQMGLPCAAISVVTDECDPDNLAPIDIEEIIAVAKKADRQLTRLLVSTLKVPPMPHLERT